MANNTFAPKNGRTVGIVIELENIKHQNAERTMQTLRALQRQITEMAPQLEEPINFMVVYDSDLFDETDAQHFIYDTGMGGNPLVRASFIGKPGISYYEQKNIGARALNDDIILLMDSDIIIQDGWLRNMIASFEDASINFVSGRTHIETPRFFDKIVALTDKAFALPNPAERGLLRNKWILANAFAYRASALQQDVFPTLNVYRGNCARAAEALAARGEKLYVQTAALSLHPSLNDLPAYFARGYAEGCDAILLLRQEPERGPLNKILCSPIGSAYRFVRETAHMIRRTLFESQNIALPVVGIPVVIGLATAYYVWRGVAELVTLINEPLATRFSIMKAAH